MYISLVLLASVLLVAAAPPCVQRWDILDQEAGIPTDGLNFCDARSAGQGGPVPIPAESGATTPPVESKQALGTDGANNTTEAAGSDTEGSDTEGSDTEGSDTVGSDTIGNGTGSTNDTTTDNSSGCAGGDVAQVSHGGCKPGFLNTVFNVDVPAETWPLIKSYGVSNFISFFMDDAETADELASRFNKATRLRDDCARIPLVMLPDDATRAPAYLKAQKPKYLGLFNEPDLVGGDLPGTPVNVVAENVKTILAQFPDGSAQKGRTTFLMPALYGNPTQAESPAQANTWWNKFQAVCGADCFDQMPIVSMHIYERDAQKAIQLVRNVVKTWGATHRIWVTELSPRGIDVCKYSSKEIVAWMRTVLQALNGMAEVDKIF